MTNPCESCEDHDLCQGEFPCKKRLAYIRWKEKAASIWKREKTKNERMGK